MDGPHEAALPANDTSPKRQQSASPQDAVASGALMTKRACRPNQAASAPSAMPRKHPHKTSLPARQAAPRKTIPPASSPISIILSQNLARLATQGAKVLGAFLQPFETGQARNDMTEQIVDAVQSFGRVAEYWLGDPLRTVEAQKSLSSNFLSLWAHTLRRLSGEDGRPRRSLRSERQALCRAAMARQCHLRFSASGACDHDELGRRSRGRAPKRRISRRAPRPQFYLRQITSALSPSNFVATNPELLRETLASNAENLVRGAAFLTEDIAAGRRHAQDQAERFLAVRARRQYGGDARQGRLSQRSHRTHPI